MSTLDIDYQLILSEVRRACVPESDIEDMAQDVCVKILERKLELVTRAYVRRLIRNMLIDKRRKDARRPKLVFDNKDYPDDV